MKRRDGLGCRPPSPLGASACLFLAAFIGVDFEEHPPVRFSQLLWGGISVDVQDNLVTPREQQKNARKSTRRHAKLGNGHRRLKQKMLELRQKQRTGNTLGLKLQRVARWNRQQ